MTNGMNHEPCAGREENAFGRLSIARVVEGSRRYFCPGHVAFVLFQFDARICFVAMIRGMAAEQTEPFLSGGIPSDVLVFHRSLSRF